MLQKRVKIFIAIGTVVALASVGIYFTFISSSQNSAERHFLENYYSLVNSTTGVTENYHKEIGKWERDEYDDQQFVSITDSFLSQFDQLLDRASRISTPEKFRDALDLYVKSLSSERASYTAFRDFIGTGDPRLNETSTDLLSNASKYELESFALINAQR
jgi:hypothetical protein